MVRAPNLWNMRQEGKNNTPKSRPKSVLIDKELKLGILIPMVSCQSKSNPNWTQYLRKTIPPLVTTIVT